MLDSCNSTRRGFLKRTAQLAAAGLAVPYLIPRNVLASAGHPGANDRVNVGFIGVGGRTGQLTRHFEGAEAGRIVAFADCNLPRAEKAASSRKECQAFADYRKMLELKDVDAVFVATPDHWHALACIHACQAGKDVYGEKPLGLTVREGRAMVEAVRKHKRVFQTGSQQRSLGPNRIGCELVRTGRIGKIHTVIGYNYPSPWQCNLPEQTVPEGLDWNMWCGQTEFRPFNEDIYPDRAKPGWASFRRYCGGEMCNWGSHGLDQVQWALGMDDSGPVEVWCDDAPIDRVVISEPVPFSRAAWKEHKLAYRYPNGVTLKLADGPQGGAIFHGEDGKIAIDRNSLKSNPKEIAKESLEGVKISRDIITDHIRNWIDCIKSREKPTADVEIGHRTATVCHLGNVARWTGRKLRWDPEKEIFPDDDEANAYLSRPRRKGYELPII